MAYLHDILLSTFGRQAIQETDIPAHIIHNLRTEFELRPYQTEAFKRFLICCAHNFDGKPESPFHLLYNMATGSGKTLIMAGLMLHLYQQGYRYFIFFVNSNNIIQKTKDNFLNAQSTKYLFNADVMINGKRVLIQEIAHPDEAEMQHINLKFTTIQQLHTDLNNPTENGLSLTDFADKKMVLIADEAHHLSSATKNNTQLSSSWEGTVLQILQQNPENMLLEFTATLDYESKELVKKYQQKVIFRYDLAQFRQDKFSKEIKLLRSQANEQERILQALILNLYRTELAAEHQINLKPVILFKAQKTIKESQENLEKFNELMANLSEDMLVPLRKQSAVEVVQKAFQYFDSRSISHAEMVKRLQHYFQLSHCLSANNDEEAAQNQLLLNTLEDIHNPIRAVFAVQKLNEGWDVLNLFDIVRLYESRSGKVSGKDKTTLSEAQLIGRGARYFPFTTSHAQNKYTRKFDDEPQNELKVLEELYYHTKEDKQYIADLKKALTATGIYTDNEEFVPFRLNLKGGFKQSAFYQSGVVFLNAKQKSGFSKLKTLPELFPESYSYVHPLSSGNAMQSDAFGDEPEEVNLQSEINERTIKIAEMPLHVVLYALSKQPFYYFQHLKSIFPALNSMSEFAQSKGYLADIKICYQAPLLRLKELTHNDYAEALTAFLQDSAQLLKQKADEYFVTDFLPKATAEFLKDRGIHLKPIEAFDKALPCPNYCIYEQLHAVSSAESQFLAHFSDLYSKLSPLFAQVWLVPNKQQHRIYHPQGRTLSPDYLLFLLAHPQKVLNYQIYINLSAPQAQEHWQDVFPEAFKIKQAQSTYILNVFHYQGHKADMEAFFGEIMAEIAN